MKEELLFYSAYQDFYKMADKSDVFKMYCKKAFGEDFSQDGFCDVKQLEVILGMVDLDANACVLDIGCGNGKMLEYIYNKVGAQIFGFDYSEAAIQSAVQRMGNIGNFKVSLIGESEYEENKFDLITSMDTMYFAPDMSTLVSQIYKWLKPNGCFICGYQEGDVIEKTENYDTTSLAKAFEQNGLKYTVINYTKETYEMLKHKREVIISMEDDFKNAGIDKWYAVVKGQTNSALVSYDDYQRKHARYIYAFRK